MTSPLPRPRAHTALALALAGAALMLLLQSLPALPPVLEYRRAALVAEPWRLLTGHFVHINWIHAAVNAGAWLALASLFAPWLDARRQALSIALSAIAISLALAIACPTIAWYRGASGALHGLFFAGAVTALVDAVRCRRSPWLPAALLVGGWIKVALETPWRGDTRFAEWLGAATVPQAHFVGAVVGTALGVWFAARRRRRPTV